MNIDILWTWSYSYFCVLKVLLFIACFFIYLRPAFCCFCVLLFLLFNFCIMLLLFVHISSSIIDFCVFQFVLQVYSFFFRLDFLFIIFFSFVIYRLFISYFFWCLIILSRQGKFSFLIVCDTWPKYQWNKAAFKNSLNNQNFILIRLSSELQLD